MFPGNAYELIDFGQGRKLERFGTVLLDRPAPVAAGENCRRPDQWRHADAVYEAVRVGEGGWRINSAVPIDWQMSSAELRAALRLTETGQIGVFPEQAANWQWILDQIRAAMRPISLLNLFAYTGVGTLVAALAGASVVHVDAARSAVAWARDNAGRSALAERPIRWIVDDVRQFVRRELRRERRYDAIICDPPSYGHGPGGEQWKLDRDFAELTDDCGRLLSDRPLFELYTCHTPGWQVERLEQTIRQRAQGMENNRIRSTSSDGGEMTITAADGRALPSGEYLRIVY